jgi:hypothetical protein
MDMDLSKILFLDIETVSQFKNFEDGSETYQALWTEKSRFLVSDDNPTAESVYGRAAIYAEFGKIVCISCGIITEKEGERQLRVKSFADHDETVLLTQFSELLSSHFNRPDHLLCGHNGKEFDFPYIARRMLVKGVYLPNILDIAGKKPWEVNHLDTMQMWKFGDFKSYTSLKLLAHVFGLPTPKDDIDGSQVGGVYWQENDLDRITRYCEKDVVTLAQVYLRMTQHKALEASEILTSGA